MILFKTGDLISLIYSINACVEDSRIYSLKRNFHMRLIQGVSKKHINKKLLVGAAHNFNSQFLNLFGFSISVSFVCCII